MIYATGSAGFIGKHLVNALALQSGQRVHGVDPRTGDDTMREIELFDREVTAVFHMGAISDTTCTDWDALNETNFVLPKKLGRFCMERKIPFIYASSASVYGNGDGPLNDYAASKLMFDLWAEDWLRDFPWYGCRFFNVYGPGEGHKGKQASMVWQMYDAMRAGERPKLFALDARRDFIHVDDVVEIMLWMWRARPARGIYDVGTGHNFSFEYLFDQMEDIQLISHGYDEIGMPEGLVGKYQFETRANLTKTRQQGGPWITLPLRNGLRRFIDAEDRTRRDVRPLPAPQRGLGS